MTPEDLAARLHDAVIVFSYVDDERRVVFAAALGRVNDYLDAGLPKLDDPKRIERTCKAIDLAVMATGDYLGSVRVGSTLLDVARPYWHRLQEAWAKAPDVLSRIWEPAVEAVRALVPSIDASIAKAPKEASTLDFVEDGQPAAPEYVAALHRLSELNAAMRLMFIRARDPDTVFVAKVNDERALDVLTRPFPVSHWRGHVSLGDDFEVHEFWVYEIGGHSIFRVPGFVASPDKTVLDALKSGKFLPRMANTQPASVLRLTFSVRASTAPGFRDTMRDLGATAASPVTWDLPVVATADIDAKLTAVREAFSDVAFTHIIDTPDGNIHAFMNPAKQVVRALSARVHDVLEDADVQAPDYTDLSVSLEQAVVASALPALAHIHGALRVRAHVLVTVEGEVEVEGDRVNADIPAMFPGVEVPGSDEAVLFVPGKDTKLVFEDALLPAEWAEEVEKKDEAVERKHKRDAE